jgi:hypothetical protein
MPIGGGELSAGHLTPVEWEFRTSNESPGTLRDRFAREVYYRFPISQPKLVMTATSLDENRHVRTLTFIPKNPAGNVKVWIGNTILDHIAGELLQLEPTEYTPGKHFAEVGRVSSTNGRSVLIPTPFPTERKPPAGRMTTGPTISNPMNPLDPANRLNPHRNPDGGFCGPDGQP